ncbi:MAG: 3-dehydroquinate synthase [bacterium]|nr:3-dehydroquinate synthase [bacterium]
MIKNSLKSLKVILKGTRPSRVVLVCPDCLTIKLNWAIDELKAMTSFEIIKIPDGEAAKDWNIIEVLLKDFTTANLDRKSLVLALGGGSVTDLVGFASSIYQRGVSYVNIPTTLLAQVDAAIGGKTAINFLGCKNQVGSFYNPIVTIIDSRFLETLNKEQFIDGLAEIIKAGLIKDPTILKIIQSHGLSQLREKILIEGIITKAIRVKEHFVQKDPKDKGVRQILNFGHTIGHALELKYGLSHGRAVLIGMMEELKLGEKLGKTDSKVRVHFKNLLDGLAISFDKNKLEVDWKNILRDKKIVGDKINLPIVKKLGEAVLTEVSLKRIMGFVGR